MQGQSWGPSEEWSPAWAGVSASTQVLLAKRKSDGMFYAVKVLQKKSILKNKEVLELKHKHFLSFSSTPRLGWLPKMSPNCEGGHGLGAEQVTAGGQVVSRMLTLLKEGRSTTSPTGLREELVQPCAFPWEIRGPRGQALGHV